MKYNRLIILLIIFLLIWNVVLTISLSRVSENSGTSVTTVVNRTVNGYSTDITATVEKIKSSDVTVETENALGSGFIYSSDDDNVYIISAYHVVSDSESISIKYANGLSSEGQLLGYDIYSDLALIRVPKTVEVTPVTIGDATLLKAGEFVFAIGTPDNAELSSSLALGMIASPLQTITNTIKVDGKTYEYYLEDIELTSLMANGYSGSAVFNQAGEVVGVVTMSLADKEIFATPINEVTKFVQNILSAERLDVVPLNVKGSFVKEMEVYTKNYLGINLETNEGFYVEDVKLNSIFKDLGLKKGDVILSINGIELNDYNAELNIRYSDLSKIDLVIIRDNEMTELVSGQ